QFAEWQPERIIKSRIDSCSCCCAIKMKAWDEIAGKVIVILSLGSIETFTVTAHDEMCFFYGNTDGIRPVENKPRMHKVVGPRPNLSSFSEPLANRSLHLCGFRQLLSRDAALFRGIRLNKRSVYR